MNNPIQVDESLFVACGTSRHEYQQHLPVSTRTKTAPTADPGPVPITRLRDAFWRKRRQYIVYIVLSIVTIGLTALLVPSSSAYFQPYFGRTNPIFVVVLAIVVGGISLCLMHTRGKLEIL